MFLKSFFSFEDYTSYFLFFAIGLVTYVAIFYYRYFNRTNPLPGPLPLPIVGNVLQYPGDAGKFVEKLRLTYGNIFEIYLGTNRVVCLCQSDMVFKLMNSSYLRTLPIDGLDDFGVSNKGVLLNRNHDDWSYHRRFSEKTISTPQFSRDVVESTQVLFREMNDLWKQLNVDDDGNNEVDFAGWLTRFTFENILLLMTTTKVHALKNYYNSMNPKNKVVEPDGILQNSASFVENLKTVFAGVHFFLLTPKVLRNSPLMRGTAKSLLDNKAWVSSNLLKIIKDRRTQIENSKEEIDSKDLLTHLLTVNTDKDITRHIADAKHMEKMSDDDVRANIMDLLLGGTLTTSSTLCAIIYHLSHNPEVKKRMVQELDEVLGSDRDSDITLDQINKLEYTDAVFKETSRLFPPIPVNLRVNLEPNEIAGYMFPANTQFMIDIEGIHQSPNYWVDPDTFNPSRWLDTSDSKDIKQRNNSYFQFGSGVRVCPGKRLGLAEVKTLVALLYRNYDIELVDKVSPLKYEYNFIKICNELKVKIRPRN